MLKSARHRHSNWRSGGAGVDDTPLENWYALLVCIFKGCTSDEGLRIMGVRVKPKPADKRHSPKKYCDVYGESVYILKYICQLDFRSVAAVLNTTVDRSRQWVYAYKKKEREKLNGRNI